jgi:DNA-binding transcriptional LysR family regulator
VKLFERDRGKTVLTAAGTAFQREATGGLGHLGATQGTLR